MGCKHPNVQIMDGAQIYLACLDCNYVLALSDAHLRTLALPTTTAGGSRMTDLNVTHAYEVSVSVMVAEPDADDIFTVARNGVDELLGLLQEDTPVVTVTDFVSENGVLARRVHTNVDLENGTSSNTIIEEVSA